MGRLLFKKRMFRDTDEAVTEPTFVNLSYLQAGHPLAQAQAERSEWLSAAWL